MDKIRAFIKTLPSGVQDFWNEYFDNAPTWLLESFQMVTIPAKKSFVFEGEAAEDVYVLLKGSVVAVDYRVLEMVYRHFEFHPVEILGAMEILGGIDSYMTTLIAKDECVLLKISRSKYDRWLNEDIKALRMQAQKVGTHLLVEARKERLNVLFGGNERVALMLCTLFELYSGESKEEVTIGRKDFVETTGLSERTVTRILKDFENRELISRKGWDIILSAKQYDKIKQELNKKLYNREEK